PNPAAVIEAQRGHHLGQDPPPPAQVAQVVEQAYGQQEGHAEDEVDEFGGSRADGNSAPGDDSQGHGQAASDWGRGGVGFAALGAVQQAVAEGDGFKQPDQQPSG